MQTKNKYENLILNEVKGIPEEALPMVVKIKKSNIKKSSGLCGIREDNRNADEIIKDIHSNRTGFGGRDIQL